MKQKLSYIFLILTLAMQAQAGMLCTQQNTDTAYRLDDAGKPKTDYAKLYNYLNSWKDSYALRLKIDDLHKKMQEEYKPVPGSDHFETIRSKQHSGNIILQEAFLANNHESITEYTRLYEYLAGIDIQYKEFCKAAKDPSSNVSSLFGTSLLDLLDELPQFKSCILSSLEYTTRIALLEKRNEFTVSASKEELMVDLIRYVREEDKEKLLDYLSKDNYKNYWDLYDEINSTGAESFINSLANLLKSTGRAQTAEANSKDLIHVSFDKWVTYVLGGKDHYVVKQDDGRIYFNLGVLNPQPQGTTGQPIFTDGNFDKPAPFDYVCVTFVNDLRFQDANGQQIKAGSKYMVPAGWIYGIIHRQNTTANFNMARAIIDVAVIVGSFGTATPYVVIADGVVATIDLGVTLSDEAIMTSENKELKEAVDAWNYAAGVWGAGMFVRSGSQLVCKYGSMKEMLKAGKNGVKEYGAYITSLQRLRETFVAMHGMDKLITVLDDITLFANLQSRTTTLVQGAFADLTQGNKLVAGVGTRSEYLGMLSKNASGEIDVLSDIQYYSQDSHGVETRVLGQIDDIPYMTGGKKSTGNFEIVEGKNGSVYLRVAEDASKGGYSKFGQRLDEIGEVLENGLVKGKYSQRVFDVNNAGGAIQKLNWKNTQINKDGIAIIRKHINRLEHDVWNDKMINRLDGIVAGKIQVTDFDLRYYTHEIQEFNRYKALGYENTHSSQIPEKVWNNTHSAALEDYKIYELMEYNGIQIRSLYHPSIQN